MLNPSLVEYSPQDNPDRMFLDVTFTDDYGAGDGVGDTLDLTPYVEGTNPDGFKDPNSIYSVPLVLLPKVPPGVFAENLAGGYVEAYLGNSLSTCYLRCFNANGTELTQGDAYPDAFLNGLVTLEILLPVRITG